MEFKNEEIKGINISRYIASWYNAGGSSIRVYAPKFAEWLQSITFIADDEENKHLSKDEIKRIVYFATNGKMELEDLAEIFIKELKD